MSVKAVILTFSNNVPDFKAPSPFIAATGGIICPEFICAVNTFTAPVLCFQGCHGRAGMEGTTVYADKFFALHKALEEFEVASRTLKGIAILWVHLAGAKPA